MIVVRLDLQCFCCFDLNWEGRGQGGRGGRAAGKEHHSLIDCRFLHVQLMRETERSGPVQLAPYKSIQMHCTEEGHPRSVLEGGGSRRGGLEQDLVVSQGTSWMVLEINIHI